MSYVPELKLEVTWAPYAECRNCVWEAPKGKAARDQAKRHVRETGHIVNVIHERVAAWGPK